MVLGGLDGKGISYAERYVPYLQHSYECWLALGTAVDFFSYKKSFSKGEEDMVSILWDRALIRGVPTDTSKSVRLARLFSSYERMGTF